jgi:hypothetical protein
MAFDPNVIAGASGSLSKWILGAQQASLTRGDRLATLDLTAVKRGVPHLPIADAVTRAAVTLTINGASYLELDVHDPGWLVERSGLLDLDDNHRLNTVAVAIDGLWFRLAAARRRSADTLTLVFEDEAKWMLDQYTSHIHVSRDSRTRAEFIGALIYEAGQHRPRQLVYVSPQEGTRQLVKHPDLPTARPRDTGFDAGTTFKIKGDTADASQMREVATAMTVADQENVTDRVRLALLVAGIGESSFRAVMNAAGSGYGGVFQGDVTARYHYFKVGDTEGQARSFLKGGKGYQAGGAIKLASDNPNMSPGEIATKVEASGKAPSFYQHGGPGYDAIAEAKHIASLWNTGTGGQGTQVLAYKSYEFTRGLPGQKESSWQAATRLAEEVNWRFFALGSVLCFVNDDWLISRPAAVILDAGEGDQWQRPNGLLSMPTYDHDHGKLAAAVTLDAVANDWSVLPGDMVALRNMGAIDGRWITETFEFDLLRPTGATITLIKPLPPLKEPAPEVVVKTIDKTGVNAPDGGKVGYPLAKRGTLIGVPYQGTHTLGNWQSDNAVDLGVPRGTKVLAVDDGTIVKTVDRPDGAGRFSGSQVTLNTATNAFFYTHLSQLGAQTGQQVHKGDVIGLSGEANGVAHLHFGAKNGDPRDLIGQTK